MKLCFCFVCLPLHVWESLWPSWCDYPGQGHLHIRTEYHPNTGLVREEGNRFTKALKSNKPPYQIHQNQFSAQSKGACMQVSCIKYLNQIKVPQIHWIRFFKYSFVIKLKWNFNHKLIMFHWPKAGRHQL